MRRDKSVLPKPAEISSKSQQLKKLLEVRDAAKNSYDKLKDLKLTVDRAIFMTSEANTISSTRNSNVTFESSRKATADYATVENAFYNRDEHKFPYQKQAPSNIAEAEQHPSVASVYSYGP